MTGFQATEFYVKHISSASDAPRALANVEVRGNKRMLPIVFAPGTSSLFTFIPQGFKAVVAIHGKHEGV